MQAIFKFTAVSLLLMLVAGCATNPVTGRPDLVFMSEDQEIALGKKYHPQVMKGYTIYENPELTALVNRLGKELAEKSHRSNLTFTFTLLDSPQVNAFATPGGYIYITRGIMAYMNNEEQLAGVLGHELGHVTARHGVRQNAAQTLAGAGSFVLGVATGNSGLAQLGGQLGQAFVSGYGRNHELEADRLGAEYLASIGYDPEMMLGVVGILKDQEEFEKQRALDENRQPRTYHGVFASHPRNDQRLQEVVRAANKFANPDAKRTDPETFIKLMSGVTFGNSESQGIVRDNKFFHKPLNLAIDFPESWRIDNRPNELIAINGGRTEMLQIKLGKQGDAASPERFLRGQFNNLRDGERIDSDSYAGIVQSKNGPVRVAAVFHDSNVLLVSGFGKSELPQQSFFNTVESVRKLNRKERKLASERKIEAYRTRAGDTFASLAAKSGLGRYAEEQLRLLNGLYPDGEPTAGQLIKIIK